MQQVCRNHYQSCNKILPSVVGKQQRCRRINRQQFKVQNVFNFLPKFFTPKKPPPDTIPVGQDLGKEYEEKLPDNNRNRRAGVVLHPTSLPGDYGIGEIGNEALKFIDWLQSAGIQCWQVLPLVPPDKFYFSPYSGQDCNCGNPLLISIDSLIEDGLLTEQDKPEKVPVQDVDFLQVKKVKDPLIQKAAETLRKDPKFENLRKELKKFREINKWVEDSALFASLVHAYSENNGDALWWEWPQKIRDSDPDALQLERTKHFEEIENFVATQFFFDKQWQKVHKYANDHGVKIVGDMPIYVGGQSADVWANRSLFELGDNGKPAFVSGVPPDAFSATGQLWNNPLYNWENHKKENFQWWGQRLGRALQLYDETRIDHFRGFAGQWSVAATEETAMIGKWKQGPGVEMFQALEKQLGQVPIIAEDLGVITSDVVDLRQKINAPGMVVLQFAWGAGGRNTHLPHMHYENCVCYPGTHDNETAIGWWNDSATKKDKDFLHAYLGCDGTDLGWAFIRESMKSTCKTCIIMMQDIMRLDNSARMNSPGKAAGNWAWRVGDSDVWERLKTEAQELKQIAFVFDRLSESEKKKIELEEEKEEEKEKKEEFVAV